MNVPAIIAIVVTLLSVIALAVLMFYVLKRKDMQALKIKSPTLLAVFLGADILSIILLLIVYLNTEVCGSNEDTCSNVLVNMAKASGYLLVCFAEPLLIVSYVLRFLRIKRIFDAQ